MKTIRSLFITVAIIIITMAFSEVEAQGPGPGRKAHPDAKWEVRKEYDEQGNLIYYDSSYIQTWKHFDFPGPGGGYAFENMDSLFGHHPFAFGPFSEFMDSLDLDIYLDSSIFQGPDGFFDRQKEWIESFREEFFFPKEFSFPDVFSFPDDSLHQLHPKWQLLPKQQKKPARGIEI
jgi:hypothetical protein